MHRAIPVSLALLLGGCAAPTAQFIPPPVPTIDFLGSGDFIITAPYDYRIGSTDKVIHVPQGFVTDYASIPPWLQGFLADRKSVV